MHHPVLRTVLFILLACLASHGAVFADDQCVACHEAIGDKVVELFKRDVHSQKRISCSGCHGGDSSNEEMEEAMGREAGFIGIP